MTLLNYSFVKDIQTILVASFDIPNQKSVIKKRLILLLLDRPLMVRLHQNYKREIYHGANKSGFFKLWIFG